MKMMGELESECAGAGQDALMGANMNGEKVECPSFISRVE